MFSISDWLPMCVPRVNKGSQEMWALPDPAAPLEREALQDPPERQEQW